MRPLAERGRRWIGQVLDGKYRVVRVIDAGGSAEVYEAEQQGRGKNVALKLLHASRATDVHALASFREDAKLVSLVVHPSVVSLHAFGALPSSDHYVVMELLSGRSVGSALAGGPIPPRSALRYAMQACEGMAAAHERGVVHGDIKPDNLFLHTLHGVPGDLEPRVKVLGLGIGKHFKRGSTAALKFLAGAPDYMSPEQIRGEPLDPASDVYAMGAVLFEMLFGEPPFSDPVPHRALERHLREPPAWPRERAQRLGIPAAVEGIVLRALAKNPKERQGSMHELHRELAEPARELRAPGAPAAASRPRRTSVAPRAALASSPNALGRRRTTLGGGASSEAARLRARIAELEHTLSARERSERRLIARQAVGEALIAASSLTEAAPRIFEAIRWSTHCETGAIWRVEGEVLRCAEVWSHSTDDLHAFADATRGLEFPRGVGLPGGVWATGRLASIGDVTRDDDTARAQAGRTVGFHAGVAFPIVLESEVLGVVDCFGRRMHAPEREQLEMLADIGRLIGRFLDRAQSVRATTPVPILEIWNGVLAVHVTVPMDAAQTSELFSELRRKIAQRRARFVLIDLSTVEHLAPPSAIELLEIVRAVEELGAPCLLTGLRPPVARGLARSGFQPASAPTLADGLKQCMSIDGGGSIPGR